MNRMFARWSAAGASAAQGQTETSSSQSTQMPARTHRLDCPRSPDIKNPCMLLIRCAFIAASRVTCRVPEIVCAGHQCNASAEGCPTAVGTKLPASDSIFITISAAMKRVILLALVSLCCGQPAVAESKPNVLILLADDLAYADVGFNGGNRIATPNLDRLAATGLKLTNFRACPMCSPTRAGLLTGRWPLRFGMMRAVIPPWSSYGLPTEEDTLPELLSSEGYARRGIVGKWHLGHAQKKFLPLENGFTRFVGHYNGAIDYFTHEREGETDWHHDRKTIVEEGYSTDLIAEEAVRFVRESPADAAWLLYVPFNAPHSPQQAKQEDLSKYAHIEQRRHRTHAAMVDSMDQAIGRILKAVESRADADNTL